MANSKTSLAILMYHSIDDSGSVVSVSPAVFAAQMQHLARRGWQGITLREAAQFRLTQGCWPDQSVVITFDDGFSNVFSEAAAILKPLGFTATVFLVTDHIDGHNDWAPPPASLGSLPMLSWSQIDKLHDDGFELAPHTASHPDLSTMSASEVDRELRGACDMLTQRFGQAPKSFAYPFGRYNQGVERAAKQLFPNICTTTLQRAQSQPLHALPRVDMFYIRSLRMLDKLIDGRLDGYLSIRRWARGWRSALSAS